MELSEKIAAEAKQEDDILRLSLKSFVVNCPYCKEPHKVFVKDAVKGDNK